MRKERLSNAVTLTLNGTINASTTSMVLDGATDLPTANGDYRVNIESEIITITAFSGNTCTIVRGEDDSTAASHSDTTTAVVLATADGLRQLITDVQGPLASASEYGQRIYGYTANDFTAYQAGAPDTLTDETWGGLRHFPESWVSARLRSRVVSAPSTPWTATLHMQGPTATRARDINSDHFGICLYESATNKQDTFAYRGGYDFGVFKWGGWSWVSTNLDIPCFVCPHEGMWFKVHDDGTDIEYWISTDGENWFSMGTLSRTNNFTTGPDEVGFYVCNMNYDNEPTWQVKHFLIS